jgi:hypothetical protein
MGKLLGVFLVVCSLFLISCEAQPVVPNSPPTPPNSISNPEPQIIKSWSGTGIKTTEPFTITLTPWAIGWAHEPETMNGQSLGLFQIYVYNVKNPNIPVAIAANSISEEQDISYIYQAGTFYLTINAANTIWAVTVGAMVK